LSVCPSPWPSQLLAFFRSYSAYGNGAVG
jgi:hypothetical protein